MGSWRRWPLLLACARGDGHPPADLLKQITTPDGRPATHSPDSAQLLNYKGSGGVTWPNHAHGHLLYPRVYALAPPSCKRAVLWNAETFKLDDVSAPSECTASAPGHGYLDVQASSFECLARSPKPFPLLILLEVQCLAQNINPWFMNTIYTFTDELFSARRLFKVVFSG